MFHDISERKRQEKALRESEEKYRGLFDSIDVGFCIIEMMFDKKGKPFDYLFLEANRAFSNQSGMENAVGRTMREFAPEHEQFWFDFYGEVALIGKSARLEHHRAEGLHRWFEVFAFRIGASGENRVAVLFRDINERKQREEQQQFILKLSDALRPLSDPSDVQDTAMQILGEHLDVNRAFYGEVLNDENTIIFSPGYANEVSSLPRQMKFSDFDPEMMNHYRAGQTIVLNDTQGDAQLTAKAKAVFDAILVRAAIGVPLVKNGKVRAIMSIHQAASRQWTKAEISLIEETADRTWAAVERARAEAALRESEAKYRSLFESINDAFALLEMLYDDDNQPVDCRFLEVSPSFESQTGLPQAQGKTLRELIPSVESGWFEHYHQALVTNDLVHFEMYEEYLNIWFEVDVFPYGNSQNPQVTIVFRNINDRKQAQANQIQLIREQAAREQERQRAETLAELDRAKTLFFSNVSHEFRTPLTLILAPLQDALSDSANLLQKQRERLELAHHNSLRLLKLVNTLLDFSRIEADRLKANYEPTDLSTYTAELASVFRSAIENANLQLIVDCPPLPDRIYVDREMWEKIVLNLLSNALKFTFKGIISVSLQPKVNRVELIVSDTGVGIFASELPHLFERFYQVKGAKGRSYEGSGIGLSLVQELVKRHGGAIAVTSAVDQGTIFTVTIPAGIAHLPADQIWVASTLASSAVTANAFVEEALHWLPEESTEFQNSEVQAQNSEVQAQNSEVQAQNSEVQAQNSEVQAQSSEVHAQNSEVHAQSSEVRAQNSEVQAQNSEVQAQNSEVQAQNSEVQAPSSKRARILLVDDNADMRGYLRRLLNQYYEVETVNDGLAALTAIRRGGSAIYDLVLADVMMPRMDGFDLLRSLRASPNTQTIPIILLSARAGEESRVQGLETGADDYLIKPFSARELLARVNANLQLAQLRREAVYREQVMQAVQTLNERLEQQVKARTAQLEAINQELEAFSSSISHDLRTPLRYISSFAEQLQGKLDATVVDASSLQTLNIITKSALEAEKMVNDLLEFSHLGKTKMHLTTVNISQLVQQVREQLQPELIGRSLHWQIEPLAMVEADPILLRLVLQNLLSNAVKYTRNNSEAAIKIGRIEQEQEVIFFVKDNGAGFDMKYCNRLFSIFQRLHPQEQFPGTGVGLATVRRIIHRHGGRIWAKGAIDQGATFYFSLPKHEV
ncbi:ATP-binding protein [Nostoc sp.]|uniref:ATP-binding protein n=1 Tax=Nostoc sp. TaxID=1180 RepID=UPI003FA5B03E